MKKYLLPKNGNFYKANLHMHTIVSDGKMTPEETKEHYMKNGYSIVAFTDHDIFLPHNDLTDENFIAINSMEIAVDKEKYCAYPYPFFDTYHLNFYAKDPSLKACPAFSTKHIGFPNAREYLTDEMLVDEISRRYTSEGVNELIQKSNEAGFLISYNHPVWSGQNRDDYIGLEGVWGVEVWNTGCNRGGYHEHDGAFEDMLREGKNVFPLATDDAHNYASTCGGWTMVKAEKLDYARVISALEKGNFYASTGPEIHGISIENGILKVDCSSAQKIVVSCERRNVWQTKSTDYPLTVATFDLNGYLTQTEEAMKRGADILRKPFVRVRVYDKKGGIAYSRAYWLEELQ